MIQDHNKIVEVHGYIEVIIIHLYTGKNHNSFIS